MYRGVYIKYFKINPPTFCCPLFSEKDQQNNKQTYCQLPIIIFLWTPEGFISPASFLNFQLNLYIPPWLPKSFTFIVLRLLQIHLWVKKLNLFNFTHASKQNSPQIWQQNHFLILVGTLCLWICYGARSVHFTVSPRKRRYTVLPTHSAAQSSKRLKTLSVTIFLWQDHCWIGKQHKHQKKTNCLWRFHFEILISSWFQIMSEQSFP